jgi:hypothetical protein
MKSANNQYHIQRKKVNQQIEALREKLDQVDQAQNAKPQSWEHVGDVEYISQQLDQLLQFLA